MIRDIMVDNPQSAKKDDIMDKLENRNDPLPEYMMAQIMEGLDINGAKEVLEQEVARYKEKRQQAYRNLQRIFKTDTTLPGATDSLKNLLQDEPSVKAKYELAFLHVQEKEYAQAWEVINSIPAQFTLSDEQLQENSSYGQLISLLTEMQQDTLAFPSADSTHIAALWDIVDNGSGKAVLYAGNMLLAMGEMEREEYVYLPSSNKSVEIRDYSDAEKPEDQILRVYPNPAKGYLVAEYHLDNMKSGVIRIITSSGKTVHKEKLQYNENKKMIDLQHLGNGTYIVQLYANGKEVHSVKVSVTK
ncbi:MAG: T9SS type A sorting domain-containing protein [Bacteroidales bacterium]|nr:T9SS type A sorting domain-containing protein [Bacteroidales bacterium]